MSKGPPLRLRDDPAIARALRDDLTRATSRAGAPYDVAAGLSKFERTLGAGGGGAPPGASAGAKVGLGMAAKGAIAGVALIGGAALLSARQPSSPSAVPAPPAAIVTVSAVSAADPGSAPTPPPPLPPAPSPPPPAAAKPSAPQAPVPGTSRARPPAASAAPQPPEPEPEPTATTSAGALSAEMEHLARIRALEDSDPAEALALTAEGNRRFASGLFTQEREAIAIGALVRLGRRKEARARAVTFLAAYPRSTFAERIKKLTGIDGVP